MCAVLLLLLVLMVRFSARALSVPVPRSSAVSVHLLCLLVIHHPPCSRHRRRQGGTRTAYEQESRGIWGRQMACRQQACCCCSDRDGGRDEGTRTGEAQQQQQQRRSVVHRVQRGGRYAGLAAGGLPPSSALRSGSTRRTKWPKRPGLPTRHHKWVGQTPSPKDTCVALSRHPSPPPGPMRVVLRYTVHDCVHV